MTWRARVKTNRYTHVHVHAELEGETECMCEKKRTSIGFVGEKFGFSRFFSVRRGEYNFYCILKIIIIIIIIIKIIDTSFGTNLNDDNN